MLQFLLMLMLLTGEDNRATKVRLRVEGLKEIKGEVRIAVFNSSDSYAKVPVMLAVVPVQGSVCEWEIPELRFGEYAVAVYHDANKNRKLDTNFVGAPVEAYGFSNNARGLFGPPTWEKVRLPIFRSSQTIVILVK